MKSNLSENKQYLSTKIKRDVRERCSLLVCS